MRPGARRRGPRAASSIGLCRRTETGWMATRQRCCDPWGREQWDRAGAAGFGGSGDGFIHLWTSTGQEVPAVDACLRGKVARSGAGLIPAAPVCNATLRRALLELAGVAPIAVLLRLTVVL